jgi:putative peptidoglycan lipid II flippase
MMDLMEPASPSSPEPLPGRDASDAAAAAAPGAAAAAAPARPPGRSAGLVAAGIFLSRIAGLVRQRVFSHYFGLGLAADAFTAALRIPNLLQNLFGEGVLSGSFIPVYARLLGQGEERRAARVAAVVGTALAAGVALLVGLGILGAPFLTDAIAPGFSGLRRELTIRLVRIMFPGVGLLVLCAWCLGILNSHRKFFLSYAAPVVWSGAMIAAMVAFGARREPARLAVVVAWAATAGAALQLAVQLPAALRLARLPGPSLDLGLPEVRAVGRAFGPVVLARGVVQVIAYVDQLIASFLPGGAVAALFAAQNLYLLPVSLFGMSIAASELPEMSRAGGDETEVAAYLQQRLEAGLRRLALFVVPSEVAFLALGDVLAALLFQTGRFSRADSVYVWSIVAGSGVGLLAQTEARLFSSTFYALRDTRTPLRFAVVRLALATGLGWLFAIELPPRLGIDPRWGAAGLTLAASLSGWVEMRLLARALGRRIGAVRLPRPLLVRLFGAAVAGAALAWAAKLAVGLAHPLVAGAAIVGLFGAVYFAVASGLGVTEARDVLKAVLARAGLGRRGGV